MSDVGGACGISENQGMDGERITDAISGSPNWEEVDGQIKAKNISTVKENKSVTLF